jgi:hypothetical protein
LLTIIIHHFMKTRVSLKLRTLQISPKTTEPNTKEQQYKKILFLSCISLQNMFFLLFFSSKFKNSKRKQVGGEKGRKKNV